VLQLSGADPDSHEAEDRKEEMKWIVENVKPKLTKMREQKTDIARVNKGESTYILTSVV